jgi:hypothetical protein
VGRLLELDAVVELLENAFRPLACTVSVSSAKQNVTARERSGLAIHSNQISGRSNGGMMRSGDEQ